MSLENPALERSQIARYYRWHAWIYDLTRWTFLRGREELIRLAAAQCQPRRLLEVGCGTGKNLLHLGRLFPEAELWGLDLSPHMLARAHKKLAGSRRRVNLIEAAYDRPVAPGHFDLVVFSYALSMFNPGWEAALLTAGQDLAPEGYIAVGDFHDSASKRFKQWMGLNHVRLDSHLLPRLEDLFLSGEWSVRPVYGGLWSFFLFLGRGFREYR
ncbi:MAG: class I SAM-dependent methyltransferase [Syntrophales bacterium]|nr:class I SAM-dependent methyltransferase [Syntrophales bacterium]MDD5641629.1 class I SAM-dependent methyltransferase [Syntrophales bacterium]